MYTPIIYSEFHKSRNTLERSNQYFQMRIFQSYCNSVYNDKSKIFLFISLTFCKIQNRHFVFLLDKIEKKKLSKLSKN